MDAQPTDREPQPDRRPAPAGDLSAFGPSAGCCARFGFGNTPGFGAATRLAKDSSGVTMIEYALILALIALALVGAVSELGERSVKTFEDVAEAFPGDDGGNGKGKAKGKGQGQGQEKKAGG
jgi:pilus assembly protein Flp/PilA